MTEEGRNISEFNTSGAELEEGLRTAFVDGMHQSNLAYRPQFVSNDYQSGRKVLTTIEDALLDCEEFSFSVAFVTMGGIEPLLQTFRELEQRGVRGRILTTDYLNFSEPGALDKLAGFSNIEVRMFQSDGTAQGFHTKGYVFRNRELYRILVGSSNMTLSALTKNKEWNTKLVSTDRGEFTQDILSEFERLWNDRDRTREYREFIGHYRIRYEEARRQRKIALQSNPIDFEQATLTPNKMQVGVIENVRELIRQHKRRALLISATGTGKTYASAFALRDQNPSRVLFVVHREQIAKQSLQSYRRVFGNKVNMGLLSGSSRDYDADFLFSTMQMMAKPEIMERFPPDHFDCLVIDEAHKSGAESYQKIIDYYKPKFCLGMTASPERTDGYDVYRLFDNNIAYEIRLRQAMEEDLLCPFHYFGITDLKINGEEIDDKSRFNLITCDDRVDYVLSQAQFYRYSGERVKGLVFCSRKDVAQELSRKFNERCFEGRRLKTAFLSGEDTQEQREDCIRRLSGPSGEDQLDYIFTVDIFNEGIDIPEVNQIIMLRPTESPVIFVQQLGRGLRKAENKEYVVVLDFIANYSRNYLIPMALSGDRTYNKDAVRKYVLEGTNVIPGASTIHFDEIARRKIFESIDSFTAGKRLIAAKYRAFRQKLGRVPTILDFYHYGEIDPMLILSNYGTYDRLISAMEKKDFGFTNAEQESLQFVSDFLVNGKRPHELLILEALCEDGSVSERIIRDWLGTRREPFRKQDYDSALNVMSMEFTNAQSYRKKYGEVEFFDAEELAKGRRIRSQAFRKALNKPEYREQMQDLVSFGLERYRDKYATHDEDNFVLYEKYSRKDVCRLLNWKHETSATVFGYTIRDNACPIFVTYNKAADISSGINYDDGFQDEENFSWMTRHNVRLDSKEAQDIINCENNGLRIYLFVKKSDDEGTDFYYMGRMKPTHWRETVQKVDENGKTEPIVNFRFAMEHRVRNDIYRYFREDR